MRVLPAVCTCLLLTTSPIVFAHATDSVATTSTSTSEMVTTSSGDKPARPVHDGPAGLDAAMAACHASVAKDAHGGPDHAAMDACLSAKGFVKPPPPPMGAVDAMGAPPGDGHSLMPPPPPPPPPMAPGH